MEVEQVLKYIKLYTGCEEHALKRIKPIIEEAFEKAKEVVYVKEKVIVTEYIKKIKPKQSILNWSNDYFNKTGLSYQEINNPSRKIEVCRIRNEFCKEAYYQGYTASEIGRYLKRDHTTILHNIFKIKTK